MKQITLTPLFKAAMQPLEFALDKLHRDDKVTLLTQHGSVGAAVKIGVEAQTGREFITEVEPEKHPGGTLRDLPQC